MAASTLSSALAHPFLVILPSFCHALSRGSTACGQLDAIALIQAAVFCLRQAELEEEWTNILLRRQRG